MIQIRFKLHSTFMSSVILIVFEFDGKRLYFKYISLSC